MLIAFNDDVEFRSRMYHIQTEDNGLKNGHITTTVFFSGKTLDSKSSSYLEQIASAADDETRDSIIKDLMTKQHQMFYQRLFAGEYESLVAQPAARPVAPALKGPAMPSIAKKPQTAKPDIMRASQQAPGTGKSLDLRSLSSIAQKSQQAEASQSGKLKAEGQSGLGKAGSSSISAQEGRQASLNKPLLRSKGVEKDRLTKKRKAFKGVRWPEEDVTIDALTAVLMEGMPT